MYVPSHFRVTDAKRNALIAAAPFATLVTIAQGRPVASHVPMLHDPEVGIYGTLICHLARANPQWRTITPETQALAMFRGPDAYVSPSAYASKREHGRVVPTWNYIAVHAWGTVRLIEEPAELRVLVDRLTRHHESARADPWSSDDAPESYMRDQLLGIVGLEITISELEGKWKLSQNRSRADIEGVIDDLDASGEPAECATADAMRATLEP